MSSITERDYELLSAYLDKALDPRAEAGLKTRMDAEPQLAAALKELRLTRNMLRRAPQRHVPRSFVLTRQMVGVSRTSLFAGWTSLNFASAAATLLLVATLIGDFSQSGAPLTAAAPAAESAPQTLMTQAATATPEIEMFAQDQARSTKGAGNANDSSAEFAQNAHAIELVLGGIALATGGLAWWKRRGTSEE